MRLTNNEKAYLKDASLVGDRTLAVLLQQKNYVFGTYHLGTIDGEYNANVKQLLAYDT